MTWDWIIRLAVSTFTFCVIVGFVIDYSRGPWKNTEQGYWLMRSKQAAAFTMGTAIIGAAHDFTGRVFILTVGILVYGIVNALLWRSLRKIRAEGTVSGVPNGNSIEQRPDSRR